MNEIEKKIRNHVKCCACGGSLKPSKFVNGVVLNKLAAWKYPVWGNILVRDRYSELRAVAILCDCCIEEKRQPKYAVEWSDDYSKVRYHRVEELKDLSEISDKDILEAEAVFYDFGWEKNRND